ncbi:MAG: universal stress protein [Alphaproteobacteria bacterium]|nr:universal stress protein [Alphaproteobacteria bacterium]
MQFKRIIAAVDVSDELASDVLRVADSFAHKNGANLRAVSVWPPLSVETSAFATDMGVTGAVAGRTSFDMHREGRVVCQERLSELVDKYAPGASATILDGDASQAVSDFAAEVDADLIVIGSHQRGFWGALFQGSASTHFIHDAPCAVFIVTKAYAKKLDW